MIYFVVLISYTKISLKTGILFCIVLNFNLYLTLIKTLETEEKRHHDARCLIKLCLL
jgi:hypothetical protein